MEKDEGWPEGQGRYKQTHYPMGENGGSRVVDTSHHPAQLLGIGLVDAPQPGSNVGSLDATGGAFATEGSPTSPVRVGRRRTALRLCQLLAVALFILGWQYVPSISWLSQHVRLMNRFFISSPSDIYGSLVGLFTGTRGEPSVWPYLENTVIATIAGTAIGIVLGAGFGLICSASTWLADFVKPFVVLANSIPRIALIPIIVLAVGPTVDGSIVSCVMVVFFLGFFNAFEGGLRVSAAMVANAQLLGASRFSIMRYLRWPYVAIFTFATIPNAISFGLIAVVTTELLDGAIGMGSLIENATNSLQASESFAVVIILSVVGLAMYGGTELLKRRMLRWSRAGAGFEL